MCSSCGNKKKPTTSSSPFKKSAAPIKSSAPRGTVTFGSAKVKSSFKVGRT